MVKGTYKKILILDDVAYITHNLDGINEIIKREKPTVIPISDAVFLLLRSKGVDCLDYHSFEYKNMYADVYDTARNWGTKWYRPMGKDMSLVDSFSLGNIVEWSTIYFFSNLLRIYLSLSEIIKNTDPEEVIFVTTDKGLDPATHPALLQKVDLELLAKVLSECLKESAPSARLNIVSFPYPDQSGVKHRDILKPLASSLNLVLSNIIKILGRISGKRKRILFLDGFHHFYDVMRSPNIKNIEKIHLQKVIGPSLLPKLYSHGIRVQTFGGEKGPKLSKDLFNPDAIKEELSHFFIYREKNLLPYAWPRMEWLLKKYFPGVVCPKLMATVRVVKKTLPDCIVTENDSTYQEKMLVVVGKSFNIPTVVVQHGATVCDATHPGIMINNFLPLSADTFFAFGEVSRNWFISMNVDPKRVKITGAARFDGYYEKRRNIFAGGARSKTVLMLLNDLWVIEGVVTDHIGLGIFYEHIQKVMELAKKNPDIHFIIRPHGHDHLWSEIFSGELKTLDNLVISREGALEDLLSRVDLVIGYTSTALIEALIYKIPVISVDTGEYRNYISLWKYGLSERAGSFEDLDLAMKELIYNETKRKRHIDRMEQNLHLFNYNNDGQASQRIAKELCSTIYS